MNVVREPERYKLSFDVGGLYLRGAPIAARLYLEPRN